MMLFPTEHARILVDNDYIMASPGCFIEEIQRSSDQTSGKEPGLPVPGKERAGDCGQR